jgi:hypothetical protein
MRKAVTACGVTVRVPGSMSPPTARGRPVTPGQGCPLVLPTSPDRPARTPPALTPRSGREAVWLQASETRSRVPAAKVGGREVPGLVRDIDAPLITRHADQDQTAPKCADGSGLHRPVCCRAGPPRDPRPARAGPPPRPDQDDTLRAPGDGAGPTGMTACAGCPAGSHVIVRHERPEPGNPALDLRPGRMFTSHFPTDTRSPTARPRSRYGQTHILLSIPRRVHHAEHIT